MSTPPQRSLPVLPSGPASAGAAPAASAGPTGPAGLAGLADMEELRGVAGAGRLRVAMVTLGCDKNTVDSERILSQLVGAGVEVVEGAEEADVVVVNTCGFIEIAKQESIETLLEAARLKDAGRVRAVVGMGCLVQRYRPELEREMPEVDLFLGLTDADQLIPELARRGLMEMDGPVMERPLRVLTGATSRHSAHLKISEGCDHTCAFCAIPLMRGKFRSTPMGLLVREARELERQGVVELNIVSQDTTWYGRDWARHRGKPPVAAAGGARHSYFLGRPFDAMPNLGGGQGGVGGHIGPGGHARGPGHEYDDDDDHVAVPRTGALPLLLERLLADTRIPWLRLFYMYPSGITRELVELIAREDRILSYLDMPIQHGSDRVLKRMRRPERRSTILERVRWLRDAVPDLALRTTVIVGFPGETEDDFEILLELLDEVGFDHLGAFAYSEEEDTAAATMSHAVPESVRRERLERLLDHQRVIAMERNDARVGRRTRVLVEEAVDGVAIGRASWQAPEVDGVVHIQGAEGLVPGRFVDVVITSADDYDLTGRIAG
jgi:ribosomal protein S12 methylthiotransferase